MFSLIITIVSIALVAALAVATIYYGGSAYTKGASRAAAATVVAHSQQIAGANLLYANDNSGTFSASITGLKDGGYLSAVPSVLATTGGAFSVSLTNEVSLIVNTEEICKQINKASTGNEVSSLPAGIRPQSGCYTGLQFSYQG
jgi:hypothetical protein